jgi:tryptophan synthase alpha chain
MSRLQAAFSRANAEGRTALITYFCAGDPDPDTTLRAVLAAAESGADVIELGMPFSDPTADGPAVQRASERALARGMTLKKTLELARRVRAESAVPLVLFGYYNPILAYGEEALCRDAAAAGIDGLLVVDLPPEECAVVRVPASKAGLSFVPLVAPTSVDARVDLAASVADTFIYYVSLTGVTGAGNADFDAAAKRAQAIRARTGKAVGVGFGVTCAADVQKLAPYADGVIVGSALVRAMEEAKGSDQAVQAVRALVKELASGTRRS